MEINNTIDHITTQFVNNFSGLSKSELNWRPTSETWSIAQNIDHLITINESYYPIFEALINDRYKVGLMGRIGFLANWFGDFILKSVEPERKKKIKTFPIWEPSSSDISADILMDFKAHQAELKKIIELLEEHLNKGIIINSPANKHIVYKLDKAIEIILTHEQRHLNQSLELYEIMNQES